MDSEPVDWNDPLAILLAAEGEDDEVDDLVAQRSAGSHRRATEEVERTWHDNHGASPAELRSKR